MRAVVIIVILPRAHLLVEEVDAGALVEYFEPLLAWLRVQNAGQPVGWR